MKMAKILLATILLAGAAVPIVTSISDVHAASKKSCVTLYEDVHFKGKSVTICDDVQKLSKLKFNDKASSVKVSKSGNGATLYEHTDFRGGYVNLKPGDKVADFTKLIGLNDVISSVNIK